MNNISALSNTKAAAITKKMIPSSWHGDFDGEQLEEFIEFEDGTELEIRVSLTEEGRERLGDVFREIATATVPEIDDDVDRILSYDRVTEAISTELAEERLNLLETLAGRIADRILLEPQAVRAFVRIEKLDRGPGALGVEIVRSRIKDHGPVAEPDALAPELVYLSNAAIAAPHLVGWVDQLALTGQPLILCVGAADAPAPQANHKMAQRRIDLLAIEQNAWVLAGRDPRCVVVATRTELDWAMKNGQICVWAPSKNVLDAVDGPSAHPRDAVALAAWFASTLGARELLVIGEEEPVGAKVPLRTIEIDQITL